MTGTAHAPLMTLCSGTLAIAPRTVPPTVAVSKLDVSKLDVPKLDVPLSLQERTSVLEADVTRALTRGAQLESHTATVAVVVYPGGQRNHVADLLMTFMRLRLGLFVRASAVENAKSPRVMLTVDEWGNITRWVIPR
ncbi:MAG: hypothetical protein ACRDSP_13600 [Pseudonocardiaceae bacterium]